jgi:hypothetical protein
VSTAIEGLKNAGKAVKDGVEHVGEAIVREFDHQSPQPGPDTEPTTTTPADCGPTACEGDEK